MHIQQGNTQVITLCTHKTGMKSQKHEQLVLEPISVVRSWRDFGKISLMMLQNLCEKEILCANLCPNPKISEMACIKLANSVIYDQNWVGFPKISV